MARNKYIRRRSFLQGLGALTGQHILGIGAIAAAGVGWYEREEFPRALHNATHMLDEIHGRSSTLDEYWKRVTNAGARITKEQFSTSARIIAAEAGRESQLGKEAVAWVGWNRVLHDNYASRLAHTMSVPDATDPRNPYRAFAKVTAGRNGVKRYEFDGYRHIGSISWERAVTVGAADALRDVSIEIMKHGTCADPTFGSRYFFSPVQMSLGKLLELPYIMLRAYDLSEIIGNHYFCRQQGDDLAWQDAHNQSISR